MALEANCEQKSQNCQIGIKPPRWANLIPNLSKWPRTAEVAWMMCSRSTITPWTVWV